MYPLGSKSHIKILEVSGANSEADKVADAPTNAKFNGIKFVLKYWFPVNATNRPKNAPATMLGANTPPSPPAPSVSDATRGFKSVIDNKNNNDILGVVGISVNIFLNPW